MPHSKSAARRIGYRSTLWQRTLACAVCLTVAGSNRMSAQTTSLPDQLTFQTHSAWSPRINIPADEVMVYGIDSGLADRIASWRTHGYRVSVMTGVAWGEYASYLDGSFDGQPHWDDAQTDAEGKMVLHGNSKDIPYIAPSLAYGKFLATNILRALDAGADAVYLEEPEFFARSGWSPTFKREWQQFYNEPWQAPNSSPDAQYRASKLKYFLYRRALGQVFSAVQTYAKQHHREIPCYVATHSLLNYAQWRIVSPESSLIDVGTNGYIAQVWTGTARTPNFLDGKGSERTFETAFLEYGAMQNLVRASGRRVWYLNDPIEDNPNHGWDDYRKNWESTLTASLLQPEVQRFEVLPWPERIFGTHAVYPPTEAAAKAEEVKGGSTATRITIPPAYETELQAVFHALRELPGAESQWEFAGTRGIGIVVSDTLMFQRAAPSPSDNALGSFYGLALPLLSHGIPVEPVQMESATAPGLLSRYKTLLLTYEGQKPPSPAFHEALAHWVRAGGTLVVMDDDKDPYLSVREWWNEGGLQFRTPREHLFQLLGLPADFSGSRATGKGFVTRVNVSPASLSHNPYGGEQVRTITRKAVETSGQKWTETGALVMRRGPLVIAAGLDDAKTEVQLDGEYIDLFDAALPVVSHITIQPGQHRLLISLASVGTSSLPHILAASTRIMEVHASASTVNFLSNGIEGSAAVVRLATTARLTGIVVDGTPLAGSNFGCESGTCWFRYTNAAKLQKVTADFAKTFR